jgi:hypothetical protein
MPISPIEPGAAPIATPFAGAAASPWRSPWLGWALAGVAALAAALVLRAWMPPDDPRYTICIFRRLTHHDCATCGMTRAFALLVRGEWRGAFLRHPLAPPLALELLLLWLATPIALVRGWRVPPTARDRWLLAHAGAFLGLWAVRLLA